MAAAVVDYSKWELLAEEEERPAPAYQQARERHQESISIIAHAIRLASPQIKSSELRRLLEFISAQHRGVHETNVKRAAEICAFFDSLSPSEQPDVVKLLLLVRALRKQFEGADEAERRRSLLVLDVAMGALNTLAAVHEIGKPQWLFDILHQEPNGAVMQKYKDLGYALDELRKPSDQYSDDLPIDMKRCVFVSTLPMLSHHSTCLSRALLFTHSRPSRLQLVRTTLEGRGFAASALSCDDVICLRDHAFFWARLG